MVYKDILVHIGNIDHCGAVLDMAILLARKHQAHLTGLFVLTHRHYSSQHEGAQSRIAEASSVFKEKTEEAGVSADWLCVDWPVVGEKVSTIINLHAFYKDIVIIGQTELAPHKGEIESNLPERIILGSGRPVLIVPYVGEFNTIGERPMVAWKGERESTRAVNDAMPFLLDASRVIVIALGSSEAGESAIRLVDHLAHHDIKAKSEHFRLNEISVGDMLLNQVWDEDCDLLVIGGYTRTSHGSVLGPVARHILKHMTVPVLMSH